MVDEGAIIIPLALCVKCITILNSFQIRAGIDIVYPSIVIGPVTTGLSLMGLVIGHRLGGVFGQRVEILGGLILFGIGLHVLAPNLAQGRLRSRGQVTAHL